jgi:tetrahydromethanopterin S-methyltransferase subunit G
MVLEPVMPVTICPGILFIKEGQGYIAGGILGKEIGIRVGMLCGFLVSLVNVLLIRNKKKRL